MPLTNKDEDMPKYGWKKEETFEWVEVDRTNKIFATTYRAASASFPCDVCKTVEFAWVRFMPSGVFWGCSGCKRAKGMGNEDCQKLSSRELTLVEAVLLLDKTHQEIPAYIKDPRRMNEARRMIAKGFTK